MATNITSDDFVTPSSDVLSDQEAALQAAHAQAMAELNRIREQASADDSTAMDGQDYSLHEAAGIGQYVIPRHTGWKALLKIIHDPVPNIDFSANIYPAFDGIIGDHFQSPYLLDPLDDKYESYESLRDNLAAVRNFLMQTYYANTPDGMSPAKARQALAEIAAFVGDGLYNNFLFAGIIPNHDPRKPHIDIDLARKKNGKGAQYIYEEILKHQRHSNWMRPFDAVREFFGGKPAPDWMLPPADATHFTDYYGHDITGGEPDPALAAQLAAAANTVASIEARITAVRDAKTITNVAVDLDAIGNHLVYTATHMEGVAQLSEPVRRDAVDIARDILRKLKATLGNVNVLDGLRMKPSDDMAALGAIKGVATVYERLLAWARANNDSKIFQNPAVIAATQAIGQLGVLAKREAIRMATLAGNTVMAGNINEQLKRLPASFAGEPGTTVGSLLDKVQSGIDTVMNRTQQVSVNGGKVGYSVDSTLGQSMGRNPTAGMARQAGVTDAARRNQEVVAADQLAVQAQAQQIHNQLAAQARQQAQQGQQATRTPPRGATVGRAALNAARTQQRQTAIPSATTPTTTPLTPAQQQAAARSAAAQAAAQAAREREEELHRLEQLRQQQLLDQQNAKLRAAKAAAARIDPNMLNGFKSATSLKGVTGAPITAGRIDPKSVQNSMAQKPVAPPAPTPAPAPGATPQSYDPNNPFQPPPLQPRGQSRY